MAIKLNGWYRLWIVLSVALLIPVVVVAITLLPGPMTLPHRAAFYDSLSVAARAQLASATDTDAVGVTMPNGHVIKVPKGIELKKSTLVLAEYVSQLDRLLLQKRLEIGFLALAVWLTGCVSLLLLGLAIAWVRGGFGAAKNAP